MHLSRAHLPDRSVDATEIKSGDRLSSMSVSPIHGSRKQSGQGMTWVAVVPGLLTLSLPESSYSSLIDIESYDVKVGSLRHRTNRFT